MKAQTICWLSAWHVPRQTQTTCDMHCNLCASIQLMQSYPAPSNFQQMSRFTRCESLLTTAPGTIQRFGRFFHQVVHRSSLRSSRHLVVLKLVNDTVPARMLYWIV